MTLELEEEEFEQQSQEEDEAAKFVRSNLAPESTHQSVTLEEVLNLLRNVLDSNYGNFRDLSEGEEDWDSNDQAIRIPLAPERKEAVEQAADALYRCTEMLDEMENELLGAGLIESSSF